MEETKEIPVWILKEISETLRITNNIFDCSTRDTCWRRKVMSIWNMVEDILNDKETSRDDLCSYYNSKGQTP